MIESFSTLYIHKIKRSLRKKYQILYHFRWADQCAFGHDTSRGVSRFSVGQNVYEASDFNEGPIDLRRAINGWYSEVDNVDKKLVDKFQ